MFQLRDGFLGFGFGVLLCAALVPSFVPVLSVVEGQLLPVVDSTKLEGLRSDQNGVYFRTEFNKRRNCKYLGLVWYRVLAGGVNERVVVKFPRVAGDNSDSTRSTGRQRTGEWFLGMSEEELANSWAEVRHQCHFLWPTTTRFYP